VGGSHLSRNPDTLAFDLLGRLLHHYDDDDDDDEEGEAAMDGGWAAARRPSDAVASTGRPPPSSHRCRRQAGLKSLLQQCDARSPQHSALLPILPCFDPPTAMSVFILEGHSQVNYVVLLRAR